MEHVKFWQEFFQLYKEMPTLWRVRSVEYSDRARKAKCYSKLVQKLKEIYPDADREMVVRKINNFRTSYRKEIKRIKEYRQFGKVYKPTLWYFDCLAFLNEQDDYIGNKTPYEEETTEKPKQSHQNNNANHQQIPKPSNLKRVLNNQNNIEEEDFPTSSKCKKTPTHKKPIIPKLSFEDKLQAKVDSDILAKSWAIQYRDMQSDQKIIARKLISDIIFHGCLGHLNMSHAIEFQEMFLKNASNQNSNIRSQSPEESDSSFAFVEQDYFNYDGLRESSTNYNSSSPASSPTRKTVMEIQVEDIKFEVP